MAQLPDPLTGHMNKSPPKDIITGWTWRRPGVHNNSMARNEKEIGVKTEEEIYFVDLYFKAV